MVDVTDLPGGPFPCAWSLETALWEDATAWIPADKRHESTMMITGEIPAIGNRYQAFQMDDLRLAISPEIDAPEGIDAPGVQMFHVQPDGTLTEG